MDRYKSKNENLNTRLYKIADYDGRPETAHLPTRSSTCDIDCEVLLIGDYLQGPVLVTLIVRSF